MVRDVITSARKLRIDFLASNEHLRKRDVVIGDLGTELQDGVKLLHLLEVLSNYKVEFGKWVKAPKTRFEKLQVRGKVAFMS